MPFYAQERNRTYYIRGWMHLRAGLVGSRKYQPNWDSIPELSIP
jgi:hypothetical protein